MMAVRVVKAYAFEVRETTSRTAIVEADSADDARKLLRAWLNSESVAPEAIDLDDFVDRVGFTFRSIRAPE
jgi:hypothetical protein